MCGRFVVATESSELVELFDVDVAADELPAPSFNIAPTDSVAVVIDALPKGEDADAAPVRRLESARWGLVPSWAKDPKQGPPAFNARIESAASTAHFSAAVKRRRAVVPATGYYEWTKTGAKTPYFIRLPDGELTALAALYEWWRDPRATEPANRWLLSVSVLTRAAAGDLASIHERMPVFLPPELLEDWLDPHTEGDAALLEEVAAAGAAEALRMERYEVDRAVGNVRNNSPRLIEPLGG